MAKLAVFTVISVFLAITATSFAFPVDFGTVGSGQINTAWQACSPVIAVIVLFAIIIVLFGCVCCKPGKGFQEFRNSNGALSSPEDGFVNPRAGAELTIFPPAGATLAPATLAAGNTIAVHAEALRDAGKQAPLRPASFSSSERPLSSQDWFYHLQFQAQEFRASVCNGALSSLDNDFVNPGAGAKLATFPPAGATLAPATLAPGKTIPVHAEALKDAGKQAPLRPASFSSSERPLSSQDWFYDPHLNFPRGQLQYVQDFGHGWFGRIVEGEAAFICPNEARTKVIVKILHEDATLTDQMFFLHEVKPHRDLKHPNILRLLGRCLETEPFLLLLESCPNGDLKTFLTQNLSSARAMTEQGVTLRMARDITAGLEFMHQHKFIHTDLAARNCLVTPDLTIKIGDYGNAIELYKQDYYIAGSVALPVRWCAPETLRCTDLTIETKEVTTAANVWTLAVVFWEIFEFGRLPYLELTDDQVIVKVLGEKTYILQSPTLFCLYKDELYHLMKLCWNPPLQRPTASQIKVILDNLVSSGKSANVDGADPDFDQRWVSSKPNTIPKTDNAEIVPASKPHGAKVADIVREAPVGAFLEDSKPIGLDEPRYSLKKSDSVQNVSGSLERLNALSEKVNEESEFDSWLKGVEVNNEEDEKFVRNISEAIRDLDEALAMEKTSSSEETSGMSSKENSPGRKVKKDSESEFADRIVDFKLGGDTTSFMSVPLKSFELSSLQNTMEPPSLTFTSLIFPDVKPDPVFNTSLSDAEEEIWKNRIERGEFSEKVKEKSKSIADLMVLTHIDPSDDSDECERNSLVWKSTQKSSLTSNNFGSDSDIRHAVLEESFKESLKKLSSDHKEYGKFDSLNMFIPDQMRRENILKTLEAKPLETEATFLGNEASDLVFEVRERASPVEQKSSQKIDVKTSETAVLQNNVHTSYNPKDDSCNEYFLQKEHGEVRKNVENVEKTVNNRIPMINVEKTEDYVELQEEKEVKIDLVQKPFKFVFKSDLEEGFNEKASSSDVPAIHVEELPSDSVLVKEEDEFTVSYVQKPLRFVFKDETNTKDDKEEIVVDSTHTSKVSSTVEEVPVIHEEKVPRDTLLVKEDEFPDSYTPKTARTSSSPTPNVGSTREDLPTIHVEEVPVDTLPVKEEEFTLNYVQKPLRLVFKNEEESKDDSSKQVILANAVGVVEQGATVEEVPRILVEEVMNDPAPVVEEEFTVSYVQKPLRFVLKEEPEKVDEGPAQKIAVDSVVLHPDTTPESDILTNSAECSLISTPSVDQSESSVIFGPSGLPQHREESSVLLGPFEDHTLGHYQGVRTTFGGVDIIDNWNEHLNATLAQQFNHSNFDSITFQSLEPKPVEEEGQIINKITNLSDNSAWSEEENDGKLRTPDDERSSDSGFRDKGSLSESVEDACEGKYNLEDIEAELEEAFVKGAFNISEESNSKSVNFEYEESKFYEDESKNEEDLSDIDGEIEFWKPNEADYYPEMSEFSPSSGSGWYLHPPEESSSREAIGEENLKALRQELHRSLPNEYRSFEIDGEETDEMGDERPMINITYNQPVQLAPIFEDNITPPPTPKSPNDLSKQRRKNVVGLMECVKTIDTETFMQYLDYMVENEGKTEDGAVIVEDVQVAEEESTPMIVITRDSAGDDKFEEDIKLALGYHEEESEQPKSIVLFEDLEEESSCKVVEETKPEDDVLLVNTKTNEATIVESPRPKSHVAFVGANGEFSPESYTPDYDLSLSEGSSKGEASTDANYSPDLLSDFYITPDKTPFQSPRTIPKITPVEEIRANNEATEIVDALLESGAFVSSNPAQKLDQQEDDQPCSLPPIPIKTSILSSTEQFLQSERLHTADLLLESSRKLERYEMSTSFMGDDDEDYCEDSEGAKEGTTEGSAGTSDRLEGSYTPDWESDSGEEDCSSSSAEFVWKLHEGDKSGIEGEEALESQEDDDDDSSTDSDSASVTNFVPSSWDSRAVPTKSALKTPENKSEQATKRRVRFKKQKKYECFYEYPREPSDFDVEADTSTAVDYSQYADWELQDGDEGDDLDDTDSDSQIIKLKSSGVNARMTDKFDFYTLSAFDEMGSNGNLNEDGEFFVSSSKRPFQSSSLGGPIFTGSQFSAFGGSESLWMASPTTDNLLDERDFVTPDSGVEDLTVTPSDGHAVEDASATPLAEAVREVSAPRCLEDNPVGVIGGLGSKRPAIETLTLDLPKNHNAELGLAIKKEQGIES